MKQKKINQLIEKNGILGFDFENDSFSVCWSVTPGAGKMVARRIIEDEDGVTDEFYVDVPYESISAVEDLYDNIVIDFVEFYLDDLRGRGGTEWNLFDDIASPQDAGLLQMLSFFGKTYGEFLADMFFWFGALNEAEGLIAEDEDAEEFAKLDEDERLTKKVLGRLGEHWLYVAYSALGDGAYWRFAKANGQIWFTTIVMEGYEFGCLMSKPIYGHVSLSDIDGMEALRDAVRTDFLAADCWELEESGEALELIGIDPQDL